MDFFRLSRGGEIAHFPQVTPPPPGRVVHPVSAQLAEDLEEQLDSCGGLTPVECRAPTKASLSLPSVTGQRRETITKSSRVETGTERDHSQLTLTGNVK